MESPAPVERLRRQVPGALSAIVEKLLAKDPGARYQTPRELLFALNSVTFQESKSSCVHSTEPASANALPASGSSGHCPWAAVAASGRTRHPTQTDCRQRRAAASRH